MVLDKFFRILSGDLDLLVGLVIMLASLHSFSLNTTFSFIDKFSYVHINQFIIVATNSIFVAFGEQDTGGKIKERYSESKGSVCKVCLPSKSVRISCFLC